MNPTTFHKSIYAPKRIGPDSHAPRITCVVRWWTDSGGGESMVAVNATNMQQAGSIIRADFARSGYQVLSVERKS